MNNIRIGDTVKITSGLGKGQVVRVGGLKDLPMGTGVVVTLAGDERATLNPANLEVVAAGGVGDRLADVQSRIYACVDETLSPDDATVILHHAHALARDLTDAQEGQARTFRLRAYIEGLERFIWDVCRNQDTYERTISHRRRVAGIQDGDL